MEQKGKDKCSVWKHSSNDWNLCCLSSIGTPNARLMVWNYLSLGHQSFHNGWGVKCTLCSNLLIIKHQFWTSTWQHQLHILQPPIVNIYYYFFFFFLIENHYYECNRQLHKTHKSTMKSLLNGWNKYKGTKWMKSCYRRKTNKRNVGIPRQQNKLP